LHDHLNINSNINHFYDDRTDIKKYKNLKDENM